MEKTLLLSSAIYYIESNIRNKIDYEELADHLGISYRYLRLLFKDYMNESLHSYVSKRRIHNAALEIISTDKWLTEIASEFQYQAYDSFTRAFDRITGKTPAEFRKQNIAVKRNLLGVGIYGPVIEGGNTMSLNLNQEECVLFGVPKVEFTTGKCNTFPACLESALVYMGYQEDNLYANLMAASGLSFRLRWNKEGWDMSSVALPFVEEDPQLPLQRMFVYANAEYQFYDKQQLSKEECKHKIMRSLQNGVPVLASGIVGPPETVIITGYKNHGKTLLGWSYFQDHPEYAANVMIDDSGYFVSDDWWEKEETLNFCFFEKKDASYNKDTEAWIKNAHRLMSTLEVGNYYGGKKAYESWKEALLNDPVFASPSAIQLVVERLLVEGDNETCLNEGRYWASVFFDELGKETQNDEYTMIANDFKAIADIGNEMLAIRDAMNPEANPIEKLCDMKTRKELAKQIDKAKDLERIIIKKLEKIIT